MKQVLPLLCLTSLVFGNAAEEIVDFPQEFVLDSEPSQEVAVLDLSSIAQQTPFSDLAQIPAPNFELPRKSVAMAVTLSSLLPGLGHTYLGDMGTAGALMGTTSLGIGMVAWKPTEESVVVPSMLAIQNVWSYGIYAAYRDARIYNGQAGYSYKMPTDSLAALAYAPFNYKILKKPEVWGGLLASLGLAATISYFAYPKESTAHAHMKISPKSELPFFALPVGIGEESLFRGYLQSQLMEKFKPTGAIILSSLSFGAAHLGNGLLMDREDRWRYYAFSLPFITVMGGYLGWLTHKNHSLQESVALHTLYDLVIFTAGAFATQAAIGQSEFALAIPF